MNSLIRKPASTDPKTTVKNFIRETSRMIGKRKKPSAEVMVQAGTCIATTRWDGDGEQNEMEIHLSRLVSKGDLHRALDEAPVEEDHPPMRVQLRSAAKQAGNHFVIRKL